MLKALLSNTEPQLADVIAWKQLTALHCENGRHRRTAPWARCRLCSVDRHHCSCVIGISDGVQPYVDGHQTGISLLGRLERLSKSAVDVLAHWGVLVSCLRAVGQFCVTGTSTSFRHGQLLHQKPGNIYWAGNGIWPVCYRCSWRPCVSTAGGDNEQCPQPATAPPGQQWLLDACSTAAQMGCCLAFAASQPALLASFCAGHHHNKRARSARSLGGRS